jgi:hypothetical protein
MRSGKLAALAAALGLGLAACGGENHYEQLADQVTKAIVVNDMRPVEKDFNALARPQLENRAKVGALSDQLNALGTFSGAHEDKSAEGTDPNIHVFKAVFSKGAWQIMMRIDADGKISAFQIHPPPDPAL